MNWEQVIVEMADPEATSEYYKTVFKPKCDKWHGKVIELEKQLEEDAFKRLEREKVSKQKIEEAKEAHKNKQ